MNMKKKAISFIAVLVVIFVASGCGKSDNNSTKFSYWLPKGEEAYYTDYADNPSIKYMTDYKTYENENGEFKMDLEFVTPVTGAERDNFNTLLATGDYTDIMDMTFYSGSVVDLYKDGVILDLTEYVEKYMPNYMAWLNSHPDYALTTTNLVDGEPRYLQLYAYREDLTSEYWGGYMYRRDWIVKYGKNPVTNASFTGSFTGTNEDGSVDPESWVDDVIFPSGGAHPIYISDWEWMFEIFTEAMQDLNITDGYCMSLPYPGYMEHGDLVSSFGGGGAHWYLNQEKQFEFGATSDDFRTYLQAMNTWYNNGWIDKAFTEHSGDLFYSIDATKVYQGKVGLWFGFVSSFLNSMDSGDEYTEGMVTYSARYPINDIYGSSEQQNIEPYAFYPQAVKEGSAICITDKAAEKDLPALFTFLDYLYSEEGIYLKDAGLSKEQYEESKDPFYTDQGLTEGAYNFVETDEGLMWKESDVIINDGGSLKNAVKALIFGGKTENWIGYRESPVTAALIDEWAAYECTAHLPNSFASQLGTEDAQMFTRVQTQLREFMNKNAPAFINGTKDPFNDNDWEAFVTAIDKYNPETNTQIYQNLYAQFSQE